MIFLKNVLVRVSQKVVPCFCGHYVGAIDSIISVFAHLHRSGFNLEFETLLSIRRVVADLWERKGRISGCFKNSTALVLLLPLLKSVGAQCTAVAITKVRHPSRSTA